MTDQLNVPAEMRVILDTSFEDYDYPSPVGPVSAFELTIEEVLALIEKTSEILIGDDEKIKDVANRSILDGPKVRTQNIYRVARNELKAAQRQTLNALLKGEKE